MRRRYCSMFGMLLVAWWAGFMWASDAFASERSGDAFFQGTISGVVTDASNGLPIPGVSVIVAGLNIGAPTDIEGRYTIANVPAGTQTVEARFLGYETQTRSVVVVAGQSLTLNFALAERTLGLDEVVVTGTAGDSRKRAIGNAVSTVKVGEITEIASRQNVSELLQSQTPGLTMMPGSGTAGTAASIRLRGAGSLNARNNPVIFVDGIRINSGSLGNFDVFGQTTSALDAISPEDIESIEVIKGPAASTLYGAEAAAGVIQIITKRGSMGEKNMQWNARFEVGQTSWPEEWRPTNYAVCTAARIANAALWPGCVGKSEGSIISNIPLSDNPNALREGMIQKQSLSVQGGGQQYSYFISGNYDTEEGVYLNNFSNRGGVRGNFRFMPSDKLDIAISTAYAHNHVRLPLGDNIADGLIISSWLANPGQYYAVTGTTGYFTVSPETFNTYDNQTRSSRFIIGGSVNFRPTSWFENRLNVGFDLTASDAEVYFAPNGLFSARASFNLVNTDGVIAKSTPNNQEMTLDYNGTMTRRFTEDVTGTLSFGAQYMTSTFKSATVYGQDLGSVAVRSVRSAAITTGTEAFSEQKSLGFYLQGQSGIRDILFLTAAVRMDNNSAFGTDINTVFYPKFSLSYVISEEGFFNVPVFDQLRLRAAWGQAGSSPGPFDAVRTYGTVATTLPDGSSVSSLQYVSVGNPELKPERGTEIELGFDASLFNQMLEIETTYYNTVTNDAIISVPVAPSTGFSGNQLQNLGKIANQGLEVLFRVYPVELSRFRMENTLTLTTNKNELVSFGDGRDPVRFGAYAPVHRYQEGKPLAAYWADRVQRDSNGNVVRNANGVPVLESEQVYIGPSTPTHEVGLGTTFTFFNNFQVYALFDYKGGHYLFNVKDWRRDRALLSWDTIRPDANVDDVDELKLAAQTYRHIQPADFIKFRDLSFRYLVPRSAISKIGISRASIAVSAHNLAVWTKYGGADPEVNFHGGATFDRNDSWTLPMNRRISATLNIQF